MKREFLVDGSPTEGTVEGADLAHPLRYLREERGKDLGVLPYKCHLAIRAGEHELFPFIQNQYCDAA